MVLNFYAADVGVDDIVAVIAGKAAAVAHGRADLFDREACLAVGSGDKTSLSAGEVVGVKLYPDPMHYLCCAVD